MRIGILSDTHVNDINWTPSTELMEAFCDVELILHAGDIYIIPLLDQLEKIAPVLAVCGDDDDISILVDKRVKYKHILQLNNKTLWLIHNNEYYRSVKLFQRNDIFEETDYPIPDIVVFGHTHYGLVENHMGILFVNPGSALIMRNCSSEQGTVAILSIDSDNISANIIKL